MIKIDLIKKLKMENNNHNIETDNNISSYNNFVKHFQNCQNNPIVSWNKDREIHLKSDHNKRKIILKEINQFDLKVYI
jgi:hypothetical protein